MKNFIEGIFVKSTQEILYSRAKHDFRWSEDKSVAIDGGQDYIKISGNLSGIVRIKIDSEILLNQILYYDYTIGNSNSEIYPNGYHGRFKIIPGISNLEFYKRLIINWEDVKEYVEE